MNNCAESLGIQSLLSRGEGPGVRPKNRECIGRGLGVRPESPEGN
jgi:hypothetical protein